MERENTLAFDSSGPMRHLPFFEELASLDDNDANWRAVSAGLVLLRLVDAWVEGGPSVAAADGWGVRSVITAIEEMPTGLPARAILSSALEALCTARTGDLHLVAPRLMAYARSLDLDGKWALAADVYDTIIAHEDPVEEHELVVTALLRRGHCLRELGDFAEAANIFTTAGQLAHRYGDMIGTLRARIGEARIVMMRGNLPLADAILDETAARASEYSLNGVRSIATHDRVYIAHMRGQHDAAVRLAYDALRDSASDSERDRILNDLAVSFSMLGVKSAARDAFLILAATAREQYQRWAASINLMELSAEDGMELQFERYRQELAAASLPPMLQTEFELHTGRGYQVFGRLDQARDWLERAQGSATRHAFNHLVFAAEEALAVNETASRRVWQEPAASDIPRDLELIIQDLREMRLLSEVT